MSGPCQHARRKEYIIRNPAEYWIDTRCVDCKAWLVEMNGRWVARRW